jgi:tRNA U34 5-methylaminomethyl-2-thiouridine-forming methyltransferase MnmC
MNTPLWMPQQTADGSYTFFSERFGETFHSRFGAKAEAFVKFAAATHLEERATQPQIALLDVCYGLGYNSAAALEIIWRINPDCQVHLIGLELDASVPQAAVMPPMIEVWSTSVQQVLRAIAHTHECHAPNLTANLYIGDARQTIQRAIDAEFRADAIFFDPFSPKRCPELWTVEFFCQVVACLAPSGALATYSRSAAVRSAMREAGLQIGTIPLGELHLPHEWSQGTVGAFDSSQLHPLSVMEKEHLQTRAAVPFRDPELRDSTGAIVERHRREQAESQMEATTRWRKRWQV